MNIGKIGIYKITNKTNGKIYVGSSYHIERRFRSHQRHLLGKSKGGIKLMLNDFTGSLDDYSFAVVEYCSLKDLVMREIEWIRLLKPAYNRSICPRKPIW